MNSGQNENTNKILNNFNSFFGQLSEAFPIKDAYEIYRDKALAAENPDEAIEFMKKSVKEARKYIYDKLFEENMGKLWSHKDGRPFMECKKHLAQLYKNNGYVDLCINEYEDLMKLDIEDNLNIKYELAPLFLSEKRYEDFYNLVDRYSAEGSLFMLYLKALYYFCQGDNINSKRFIKQALEANLYVAQYMLFIKRDIGFMNVSRDELIGIKFGEQMMRCWGQVGPALYWLVNEYFSYCGKYGIDTLISKEEVEEEIRKFLNSYNI